MTLFVVIAGALALGALAFLLAPLLARKSSGAATLSRETSNAVVYRDQLAELDGDLRAGTLGQDQWGAARTEIERRMREDAGQPEAAPRARAGVPTAVAIGVAVPLVALGLYLLLGSPEGIGPGGAGRSGGAHAVTAEQIDAMVQKLAARLEREPEDAEGWVMLARSYGALGRFAESSRAYAKATERLPGDAQLLADYADILAMAQGRQLQGEPEALVKRALRADPNNLKALALAGTVAFEKRDFDGAIAHWKRILDLVPAESEFAQSVRGSIADAQGQRGGGAKPAASKGTSSAALTGLVTLAPALASRVSPQDTVFIFARAAQGGRLPLALLRKQARDFPIAFKLDESNAMNPAATLASAGEVIVVARVSRSGSATAQPGDLVGTSSVLKPGAKGIRIEISGPEK